MTELELTRKELLQRRSTLVQQSALGARVRSLLGRGEPLSLDAINRDLEEIERRISEETERPERDAKKAKRGAELLRDMRMLDARIEAAMESIAPLLQEADDLVKAANREFVDANALGTTTMLPPLKGTQILGRLAFWNRDERGTFNEKIRRYRSLRK